VSPRPIGYRFLLIDAQHLWECGSSAAAFGPHTIAWRTFELGKRGASSASKKLSFFKFFFNYDLMLLKRRNFMKYWPHAPCHIVDTAGTFIVTSATYNKELLFKSDELLDLLEERLFHFAEKYKWMLQAWAIFPNHYHFIAQSPSNRQNLSQFLQHYHSETAIHLNKIQNKHGRKVWFQFWETRITFQKSYLARLNYVIQNPVKHGIVKEAQDYRWCSANWFKKHSSPATFNTVTSFKIDNINIKDDF
jgi:putative transposase